MAKKYFVCSKCRDYCPARQNTKREADGTVQSYYIIKHKDGAVERQLRYSFNLSTGAMDMGI